MAAIVRRREAPNTNSITIISIDSSRLDPPLWHIQPQAMPGWIITTTVRYTSVWQTHNTEIRLFKISSFSILSSSSFILQKLKCVFTSIIQLQSSHVHQQHERAEPSPAILQHSRSNFQQHFQSIHLLIPLPICLSTLLLHHVFRTDRIHFPHTSNIFPLLLASSTLPFIRYTVHMEATISSLD